MAHILVVEDNPDLAFALTTHLELEGFEVRVAADGPAGVAAALEDRADLIVLDVMLPGFDGFRVLRTIRERGLETPVLMLTARGEETDKVRGLRMGADDYLTKPFGSMELLARVDALLRRARLSSRDGAPPATAPRQEVIAFGDIEILPDARIVKRDGQPVTLRPREFDLLLALVRRQGRVASRQELLQEVCGYDADVASRTIDIHVAELRRKLEAVPSEPRHIITVMKAGYRFES